MGRCLLVANQTLGGRELDEVVRDRIAQGDSFYVVVPMTPTEYEVHAWFGGAPEFQMPAGPTPEQRTAMEEARQRSEHRLRVMLERLEAAGGEADGEVGSGDPYEAVRDVLGRERFDEVIVSTLPGRLSRWLKLDLPARVARATDTPVTTVEAAE